MTTPSAGWPAASAASSHGLRRKGIESNERLGRHRWVVERTLACLTRFRQLTVRYERRAHIDLAFLTLGYALVCWQSLNL